MGSKTDYLRNKLLNYVLTNAAYTAPTTVYVALFTTSPTAAGGGTEISVTATGYARQAATFTTATADSSSNSGTLTFGPALTSWGTLNGFAILDNLTGGNMLYFGDLSAPKTVGQDDQVQFSAGSITISET